MRYIKPMQTVLFHGIYVTIPYALDGLERVLAVDPSGDLLYFEVDNEDNVSCDEPGWFIGRGDGNVVCLGKVDLEEMHWTETFVHVTPGTLLPHMNELH
ncbi:MAG: hypothetical protein ACRCWQ_02760 [Bacilli bacterium]